MLTTRKLPVSMQDFEDLRANHCLYVDKTKYIYPLAAIGKSYFLGRPRRFGKSLFLSTLKAYFLGKKELFEGLAIAELEKDWIEYPVIYIDFNKAVYKSEQTLNTVLDAILRVYEQEWNVDYIANELSVRFDNLIQKVAKQSGRKVVVLVDEYDKPLLNTINNSVVNENIRDTLKGFYGVLKGADANLRFVFFTGVTKFSKISVFSDLNHLTDISLNEDFAGICGMSETELTQYFQPEIKVLADKNKLSYDETLADLKKHYDGYHFAKKSEDIYNPYSVLNTFFNKDIRNYWFETGTPTFLVKMLKDLDFDIKSLENDIRMPADYITDYRAEYEDPVPLLYQSG
ncbi:MAG: AAA family ATPase, partial [Prevotellaceae bacterium]|nr:AAA family ATPase [Prevotellaceae bacterium]